MARAAARCLRCLLGVLALIALATTLLATFLSTHRGRAWLLEQVVPQLNRQIAGQVSIGELDSLGPSSLGLRDLRLRAPAGNEVLVLEHVRVELALSRLLRGEIVIRRLALDDTRLDLRALTDRQRGVVGALARRGPQVAGGDVACVRVERLSLTGSALALPRLPGAGALTLAPLALDASLTACGSQGLELRRLEATIRRGPSELGRVTLRASLASSGAAGRLALRARVADSVLTLDAEGVRADREPWRAPAARARLSLHGWNARALALLLDRPELRDSFPGSVALDATLDPSRDAARARMTLAARPEQATSPLPFVNATGELDARGLHELELELRDASSRARVRGDLSLAGEGKLTLDAALALESVVQAARVFGVSLPPAHGRLSAHASIARARSGRVDLRGQLESAQIDIAGVRIAALDAVLAASAAGRAPRLDLKARWRAGSSGAAALAPGWLIVRGGPARYRVQARSTVQPVGGIELAGWLERRAHTTSLELDARGTYRERAWSLRLSPSELSDGGRLHLSSVTLLFAGQRLVLRGSRDPSALDLRLELEAPELGRLLGPLAPELQLQGRLTGRAHVDGSAARPRLALELRGERLRLAGAPSFDANVRGTLSTTAGELELEGELAEHRESTASKSRLGLALAARSHFARRGGSWLERWRAGEHAVELEVTTLDSDLLRALGIPGLPLSFDLNGKLALSAGARGVDASWQGASMLTAPGASSASAGTHVLHTLHYAGGALKAHFDARDEQGPWLTLDALVELLPPGTMAPDARSLIGQRRAWTQRLLELIEQAAWQARIEARERTLASLPALASLDTLASARAWARGKIERTRGAEPRALLELGLADVRMARVTPDCKASTLAANARLELADGQLQTRLVANRAGQEIARVDTRGRLDYAALLRARADALRVLDLDAELKHFPLAELPFACGQLLGYVSARAQLHHTRRRALQGSAELTLDGFSRGAEQTLDLDARLQTDGQTVSLESRVNASGKHSSASLDLPISTQDGVPVIDRARPLALALRLDALPLAPFVHPRGAVSYASGSLSGTIDVRGSASAPQLAGKLSLNDISFTATKLAQPLSDIRGEITLAQDTVRLHRLSARDGAGALTLDGRIDLTGLDSGHASLALQAHDFPLRSGGDVVATTSARAQLDALWDPAKAHLRVGLAGFDTWLESGRRRTALALEAHPDVRVDGRATRARPSASAANDTAPPVAQTSIASATPRARSVRFDIDAGEDFWIKRDDFSLKLNAKIRAEQMGRPGHERMQVTGHLTFDRGYIELLGKTFSIQNGGTLRFVGEQAIIDLTAMYEDRRTQQVVKVHVSGSSAAPRLRFMLGEDPISPGRAFQIIYGAQQSDEEAEETQAQASQLIAALTTGLVSRNLRRVLGAAAPIVMVQPSNEQEGGQLHAGFELDPLIPAFLRDVVTGMYVEGVFSSEKSSADGAERKPGYGVLLELYFPYNIVTSGRYGPNTTWSVDVGWQP